MLPTAESLPSALFEPLARHLGEADERLRRYMHLTMTFTEWPFVNSAEDADIDVEAVTTEAAHEFFLLDETLLSELSLFYDVVRRYAEPPSPQVDKHALLPLACNLLTYHILGEYDSQTIGAIYKQMILRRYYESLEVYMGFIVRLALDHSAEILRIASNADDCVNVRRRLIYATAPTTARGAKRKRSKSAG